MEINVVELLCDSDETAYENALGRWVTQKQAIPCAPRDAYVTKKTIVSISCPTLLFSPPFLFPLLSTVMRKNWLLTM